MSDLGAIFHVKKDGVQYDAHAYTTTDECPEPNLKIKFNGSPAYIKLEAKGKGDVPCYVKKSDGGVYQVIKDTIAPTGQVRIYQDSPLTFIVPSAVKVLQFVYTGYADGSGFQNNIQYLGVTPGTSHTFLHYGTGHSTSYRHRVKCTTHPDAFEPMVFSRYGEYIYIKYSPEINKQTPTITDYN